jgi:hypothetical protein
LANKQIQTDGIMFIDYFEKGHQQRVLQGVIGAFKRLNQDKNGRIWSKKVLFYQNNALCHKPIKTTAKLHELGYKLLPHSLYSPDLTLFCLQTSQECLLEKNLAQIKR